VVYKHSSSNNSSDPIYTSVVKMEVVECVDITKHYEDLLKLRGLDNVKVFYVTYINEYNKLTRHHISYEGKLSANPTVRALQEECIKRNKGLKRYIAQLKFYIKVKLKKITAL
jgi:hypothetical protein